LAPPAPQQVFHVGALPSTPMSDPVLARFMPAVGPDGKRGFGRGGGEVRWEP
jgi:hypothetical protein